MKNHIEERRKARGMTQQQLAAELGVSRQTIISLENGKYNPSILLLRHAARLSSLFNVVFHRFSPFSKVKFALHL